MQKTEIKSMIKYHTSMMDFYYPRKMMDSYSEHLEKKHALEAKLYSN